MTSVGPAAAASNILANPGFETGNLSSWSCSSIDSVVSSPVHSGSHALAGAANNSDDAQCTQTVTVLPNSAYTLSAYVEGNYVYIGANGYTSNWTPSAASWQSLSTSFTTNASTTSLTIFIHGWYAQGTYYADDVSLIGPGGGGTQVPGAPTGLRVTGTTSSSASLSWTAPSGSTVTGYDVYRGGTQVGTTTSTSFTDTGLSPSTSYTYTVAAYNSAGVGSQSGSVTATTGSGGGTQVPGAPTGLRVTGTTSSSVSLSWTGPSGSTVSGYNVYRGGSQVGTTSSTSFTNTGLSPSTSYTYTVAAYNSAGTGAQSGSVTATTQSSGGGGGSPAFAPYVDLTSNQEGMLDKAATTAGLKNFTVAFVTGSGCTPIWGDTLAVTNDPTVTGEITKAEGEGAQPIVSFGGEAGTELAQSCSNLSQLTAAYQSVINTLGVKRIDFDIEGALIAFPAVTDLRNQAINTLEANNPGLSVSFTIPTLASGPDFNGLNFLQQAKNDGTRVDVVNVMAMDYGGGATDMGADAVSAAQATLTAVKNLWPSDTYANVGVTPMIGVNDDSAEVFTEANAQTLVSFAQSNHLGRLAFWSVDRDQPCSGSVSGLPNCSEISQSALDFTRIFNAFTG